MITRIEARLWRASILMLIASLFVSISPQATSFCQMIAAAYRFLIKRYAAFADMLLIFHFCCVIRLSFCSLTAEQTQPRRARF
jgi:hypothetical protein